MRLGRHPYDHWALLRVRIIASVMRRIKRLAAFVGRLR